MKLLRRKIDQYLQEWKNKEDRLPLIIKGARQVGKTASIMQFASANYPNVVAIKIQDCAAATESILLTAQGLKTWCRLDNTLSSSEKR